nr:hypothetical protein CFP56_09169 [Quercus suber]
MSEVCFSPRSCSPRGLRCAAVGWVAERFGVGVGEGGGVEGVCTRDYGRRSLVRRWMIRRMDLGSSACCIRSRGQDRRGELRLYVRCELGGWCSTVHTYVHEERRGGLGVGRVHVPAHRWTCKWYTVVRRGDMQGGSPRLDRLNQHQDRLLTCPPALLSTNEKCQLPFWCLRKAGDDLSLPQTGRPSALAPPSITWDAAARTNLTLSTEHCHPWPARLFLRVTCNPVLL